jgi:hypothetical protein
MPFHRLILPLLALDRARGCHVQRVGPRGLPIPLLRILGQTFVGDKKWQDCNSFGQTGQTGKLNQSD